MTEWKTCPVCASIFIQPKPPKAEQTYCSYGCHLKAKSGNG